jgi:hypothetical protein
MTKTTGLAKGLSGNCNAADLSEGDRLVVTHGRSFSRVRASIDGVDRLASGLLRVTYVVEATGTVGYFDADPAERFTKLAARS